MSIARLKKVTFIMLKKHKPDFLAKLQTLGCAHIMPLNKAQDGKVAAPTERRSPRAERTYNAIMFLESVSNKRRPLSRANDFDVEQVSQEALQIKSALRDASDKADFLRKRIQDMKPWGDIEFPPNEELKGYHLWFYMLPRNKMESLQQIELPWQIVSITPRFAYVVVIAKQEPQPDLLPVARTHVGALPMQELSLQLEQLHAQIEDLQSQREALTRYLLLMRLHLAEADDKALLKFAGTQTLDNENWVILQAWVPTAAIPALDQLCDSFECARIEQSPSVTDEPPTLIEQPEILAAGKDMSLFYQTPHYRSWDPSKVLLASFCLFFSMILADAGYGIVLLVALLLSKKHITQKSHGHAYYLLGLCLSVTTVLYGVMVGSYFGMTPSESHWLGKLHILNLNDFDSMMQLSIFIGAIHIGIANAMQAFTLRHNTRKWSSLGWICLIIAGVLVWQYKHIEALYILAVCVAVIGVVLITLFSTTETPLAPKQRVLEMLKGLLKLTGIMGIFGDVLSYMRLFALGLASASLAITFNQLAADVYHSSPGLGLLGAILILLIGHILNIALSLISGVVHGLRLNFIEFYKWGLPNEGKPFQRFARKEINHE
ncbi:V-type ATP synthase subunit I [Alteromonas facilis]|uniref:V-type ATP synthase subunit I n=1 Tax=Alteromonas facilis TaxID=2048004 RepID=UPI000C28ABCE|nr:hypothetical protein [Alteromonas facilis]